MTTTPRFFLLAGEPSGDLLGARLMAALRTEHGGEIDFAGIGGERMAEEGLTSLFPMRDLSLMGLAEVLPKVPKLLRRLNQAARAVDDFAPDTLVTIDAPSFNFRLLKRLAGWPGRKVHYVAPQVWAWRPGRAKTLAARVDLMLTLLPFEPAFFADYGLDCAFVGHPMLEEMAAEPDLAAFRDRYALPEEATLIAMLPGSRSSEVARHLPLLHATAERLVVERPNLIVLMPTVTHVAATVRAGASRFPCPVRVIEHRADRFAVYRAAALALHASGSVALELALSRTPMITLYRTNPLTAALVKRMAKVEHANLINLIADQPVIPEFLQDRATADALHAACRSLLDDDDARRAQHTAMQQAIRALGGEDPLPPSRRAARAILNDRRARHTDAGRPSQAD